MSNRRIAWTAALLIALAALIVLGTWLEKRRRAWRTGDIDDRMPAPIWDGEDP